MYKLTKLAVEDFSSIYDYTFQRFGERQADAYAESLESFLNSVADMPSLGRYYPTLPDVMRIEFQKHSIFYKKEHTGILVIRILHQQMNHMHH
ncbi:type II toxin-antitoxin system RelE/ParE family toxin [Klebsiella michiganensis]|uniref:type II toxin-antitoxin system RelE/ParE family toxin n=1 Tax=Klebsiella michiganensis TaxID=1134687 RepID=UPI0025709600|nr:type II toxin-antitoxin system RelE/ParE family toxin [Klebsiella michiganensis]MDL4454923.1 type II toxin-antitoxin system RelE/ParE family toxin [Klebsiella michiganensis]